VGARDNLRGDRYRLAGLGTLTIDGVARREALDEARALLDRLDLADRADTYPATLSGGEQQRLAVARAVINDPAVVLADEPTAALDTERGKAVMRLLRQLGVERRAGVIVVTHDERMIEGFDRVYHMVDGRIDRQETAAIGV
jgi:putative ABC transport system ATP-binding protein